ncbi:MAG: gluconate 2-dehydrogenase subunit 3 family protein [Leadbetterella sp.]
MNRREYIEYILVGLGYSFTAGSMTGLLSSCKSSSSSISNITEEHKKLLSTICDTILPKTTSPSAVEVGVINFIEASYLHIFSKKDKEFFIEGLDNFSIDCKKTHNKAFEELDKNTQTEFLLGLDKTSDPFPINMWGINLDPNPKPLSFFRKLKGLCLTGYFTSETIMKNHLAYLPIPDGYQAEVPLKRNQKAWAE